VQAFDADEKDFCF